MPVHLSVGESIAVNHSVGRGLVHATIGLGWSPLPRQRFLGLGLGAPVLELETSCSAYDDERQLVDRVWYRQSMSRDGSISHRDGDFFDCDNYEEMHIDLANVPAHVQRLVFAIHCAPGVDFSALENVYCRLLDTDSGDTLAHFDMPARGMQASHNMAALYRQQGRWCLQALDLPRGVPLRQADLAQ